ncbi:hypothetical protein [Yersinia intermedia]|uniref:hypothetical protein n=1 Tax=Yersinia intermedia TaxID=631 RepID=UPI001CFCC78F|nr:hypothetical protein [Yersinia intermedia]MCB5299243.1 hypothetical protein [Yersinia intermedia]
MMKGKAIIELKTERDIRLFLWLNKDDAATLNFQIIPLVRTYNANQMYGGDINVAAHAINEAFFELYNPDILNSYMFRMKRKKECFLPSREFGWFKKCQDSCYFIWTFVRCFSNRNRALLNPIIPNDPIINTNTPYNYLDLPLYPVSHQERVQSIVDFFDRIDFPLINKINLMSFIRSEWHARYHLRNNLPLTEKDKKKCDWAWDYVNKDKRKVADGAKKRIDKRVAEEAKKNEVNSNESVNNINAKEDEFKLLNLRPSAALSQLGTLSAFSPMQFGVQVNTALSQLRALSAFSPMQFGLPVNTALPQLGTSVAISPLPRRDAPMYSPSFLSLFRPVNTTEKYRTLNCIYIFLYHKDPNFLERFTKAWESLSHRKSIKKNKNKTKNILKEKIITSDVEEVISSEPEKQTSEQDAKLTQAKEIMKKVAERNASISSEKDLADANLEPKGFIPWF